MQVISIFEDKNAKTEKEGQINTFAWAPQAGIKNDFISIGTVAGTVKVIDIKKNKVIAKNPLGQHTIFDMDWSRSCDIIAACCENS